MLEKSIIENLSQNLLQSINNGSLKIDYGYQKSNLFSFIPVLKQNDQLFNVEISSNKMKQRGQSFLWYRNRNIPQITISRKNQAQKTNSDSFEFLIGASFSTNKKLSLTQIRGVNHKLGTSAIFDSLKFEKTSYILNGSLLHLMVIIQNSEGKLIEAYISSPVYVTSWKNYLQDKPSKYAIFSPFLPAHLSKVKILSKKNEADEPTNQDPLMFKIKDSIQGLSDYFKGSTIKQKICHPLYLVILFSKTINLYLDQELIPSFGSSKDITFKRDLLINIQKYFINCLSNEDVNAKKLIAIEIKGSSKGGFDEKVKSFLDSIYSESVHLISSKDELEYIQRQKYTIFPHQNDIQSWILAYRIAFSELEGLLLKSQNSKLQQKQLKFYLQTSVVKKEVERNQLSSTLYSLPKVEITLNKQFVDIANMIEVPVSSTFQISSLKKRKNAQITENFEPNEQKRRKINEFSSYKNVPFLDNPISSSSLSTIGQEQNKYSTNVSDNIKHLNKNILPFNSQLNDIDNFNNKLNSQSSRGFSQYSSSSRQQKANESQNKETSNNFTRTGTSSTDYSSSSQKNELMNHIQSNVDIQGGVQQIPGFQMSNLDHNNLYNQIMQRNMNAYCGPEGTAPMQIQMFQMIQLPPQFVFLAQNPTDYTSKF